MARARVEEENVTRLLVVGSRFVVVVAVLKSNGDPGSHKRIVLTVHSIQNTRQQRNLARRKGIGDLSRESLCIPTANVNGESEDTASMQRSSRA